MESWDDEDFEPQQVVKTSVVNASKWEGEDEDDNVKESWEDEEEEQKPVEEEPVETKTKPKKRTLAEIAAEKERLKREENERRLREEEEEDMSPEEKLKRQQESDLKVALETTFGFTNTNDNIQDNFNPTTTEEFNELADSLGKKVQALSKSAEYPGFAENLVRNVCVTLTSNDIKKIKTTIDNLYLEKQKIEKGDKARKNKGKGKARIKVEDDNQYSAYVGDYDDFDDFM